MAAFNTGRKNSVTNNFFSKLFDSFSVPNFSQRLIFQTPNNLIASQYTPARRYVKVWHNIQSNPWDGTFSGNFF